MISLMLNIAKTRIGGLFVGCFFSYLSTYLPVDRLYETESLLAFHHPKPNYPVHILLVPKKAIASYKDLSENDHNFLLDVFRTTQLLVEDLSLEETGYRLILNGGVYQKVPQLHFHLVADEFKSHEGSQPDHFE
jgi:histidine triad (HIT) family protein